MTGTLRTILRTAFGVVAPTLALCLVMLELGLRLLGQLPSNATEGMFHKFGSTYRLKPNVTKRLRTPSYTCTVATNTLGLRDRSAGERTPGPGPYFVFMGDSITFGNGVDYDDSFVGSFSRVARSRGYDAVNLAIGGHCFSEQEMVLKDFLAGASKKPSWVVVVFTNTFMTGFERDSSRIVVKNGYLFDKDRWVLPYAVVMLGDASSAYNFFRDKIRHLQGRTRPMAESARDYLADFAPTSRWADPALRARFSARLTALDELVRGAGATPLYVYMPTSMDLDVDSYLRATGTRAEQYDFRRYHDLLADHAAQRSIPLVDVTPTLAAMRAGGKPMTFLQDPHYNPEANHAIAEALAAALLPPTGAAALSAR